MMPASTDELGLKKLAKPGHAGAREAGKPKGNELGIELVSVGQMGKGAGLAPLPHNGKVEVIDPAEEGISIPGGALLGGELKPNGLRMANLGGEEPGCP